MAEAFDVVVHHLELVGDGGVGDGGFVEDDVAAAARFGGVAGGGDDVAREINEVGEVGMGEVVQDHDFVGGVALQAFGEVGTDEAGAAGDEDAHGEGPPWERELV